MISNALKSHKPDLAPRIQVRSDGDDDDIGGEGHCRVSVVDQGIGFPSTRVQRIFQPFRRLVGSQFEGSGTGMASAKKIVRPRGGTIRAEGREDEGATFTVTLPRAECLSALSN